MRRFPEESIAAKYLINTHMMVKVVAFHPENQTVDVIQEVYDYVNTTDGDFVVQNEFGVDVTANVKVLDVLYGIPVKQERFGQFSIRCCPKEGDTGYLEIFTEDLQDWYEHGGPSVPWAALRFLRKNSVFVPFVPNKTNCASDYPATNDSLVIKSNRITVTLTDSEGSNESLSVAMGNGVTLNVSASGDVTISATKTTINGNLQVNGTVTATGEVTGNGIKLSQHKHLAPLADAINTSPVPASTDVPTP